MEATFTQLERNRLEYRALVKELDGFTADQQVALTIIHNQAVSGGASRAVLLALAKPTLRALLKKGVIDTAGKLTESGREQIRKFNRIARQKS